MYQITIYLFQYFGSKKGSIISLSLRPCKKKGQQACFIVYLILLPHDSKGLPLNYQSHKESFEVIYDHLESFK